MTHFALIYPCDDTYIASNSCNQNFSNYIINWIGINNCRVCYRTLLRFNLASIPTDAVVACATLKLYVDYAENPHVKGQFTPYAISSPWEESKVTWASCPSFDKDLSGSTEGVGKAGWYHWDLTPVVKEWLEKPKKNYGVIIKEEERLITGGKRLIGGKNTKQNQYSFRPVLSIDFELPLPDFKNVNLASRSVIDKAIVVKTKEDFRPTIAFDTATQSQVTFFVINTGEHGASVILEVGPDKVNYAADNTTFEVLPGRTIAIIPRIYGRYTRLIYKSKDSGQNTSLKIVFQSCI